jgi:hypothetical protein
VVFTPILVIQWIAAAIVSIWGSKVALSQLGFDLTVQSPTAQQTNPTSPQASGGGNGGEKPPAGNVIKDIVSNPSGAWGLAALAFASVFVIAQLRAAGRDASAGVRGIYKEAQFGVRTLNNPEKITGGK